MENNNVDNWKKESAKAALAQDKPVDEILQELGLTQREFDSLNLIPQTTRIEQSLAEKIIDLYLHSELSMYRISLECKVSVTSIYRVLSDNNIPIRKQALKSAEQLKKENVVKLYQEGHTYETIRQETDLSYATITKYVRQAGITLRQHRG